MRSGFYQESEPIEGHFKLYFSEYYKRLYQGKSLEWANNARGEFKEYWLHPGEYKHKGESLDFVLNLEELVTMWHFPGKAFGNTTGRVESIKSDPPRNLPI